MFDKHASDKNKKDPHPDEPLQTPLDEQGALSDFTEAEIAQFRKYLAKRAQYIKDRLGQVKKSLS